jgi:hypothetical protein
MRNVLAGSNRRLVFSVEEIGNSVKNLSAILSAVALADSILFSKQFYPDMKCWDDK